MSFHDERAFRGRVRLFQEIKRERERVNSIPLVMYSIYIHFFSSVEEKIK